MLWLLPLVACLAGLATLTVLAARVRRELNPTVAVVDRFGREHHVALDLLQDATERTRGRLRADDRP